MDFLILNFAFFTLNLYNRGTFRLSPEYEKILLVIYGLWFLGILITQKFEFKNFQNYYFALAAGIYAHGLLSDNNTTYDFGKTLTHALVLNGLATVGLKLAAWNHVPNGELFGWPSGHTSSTMTVASVVHEYYGLLPAAPLYALTGLVMYERMITGEHWASDVIFGTALGYVVGHTVAGQHRMQVFGMDVIPYTDPYLGTSGIALIRSW